MIKGVQYVVDERGEPTAVVIDRKTQRGMWQDFYDRGLAEWRRGEPLESMASGAGRVARRPRRSRACLQSCSCSASPKGARTSSPANCQTNPRRR